MFGYEMVRMKDFDRVKECLLGVENEIDALLAENKELRTQASSLKPLSSIEDRFGPMDERELVECLAVGDDDPLLRAVVHVLHRESLKLADRAGATGLGAAEAKGLAMSACAVEDSCDELLRIVEVARRRRAGEENVE